MAHFMSRGFPVSRRRFLRTSLGVLGLSLPEFLAQRCQAQVRSVESGKAKSCIVFFCWGGMSQLETWDPKPDAPVEVRNDYRSIATATPGVRLGEWLPLLARQTERLAIVRTVHHKAADPGPAATMCLIPSGFAA